MLWRVAIRARDQAGTMPNAALPYTEETDFEADKAVAAIFAAGFDSWLLVTGLNPTP